MEPSLGFELKHIAGSVDRLTSISPARDPSPQQLDALKREHEPDADLGQLLEQVEQASTVRSNGLRQIESRSDIRKPFGGPSRTSDNGTWTDRSSLRTHPASSWPSHHASKC